MKQKVALLLVILSPQMCMASKLQRTAIVTHTDCSARGISDSSCLPGDDQVWDSTNGQTLAHSISVGAFSVSAPTGTSITSDSPVCPAGFIAEDATAVSRTTYASLFGNITIQTTGTTAMGSMVISSVASTVHMAVGMPIDGPGIPVPAYITAKTSSTITISANATATVVSAALVVSPWGQGDGLTTFNLPDKRGAVERMVDPAGLRDPDFASRTNISNGQTEGSVVGSYQADMFASHTHGYNLINPPGFGGGSSGSGYDYPPSFVQTGAAGGNETRGKNVGVLKCVKY